MTSPHIMLRQEAPLVEEHLTDAIAFVMSHYREPKGTTDVCLGESRIKALLNVLGREISNIKESDSCDALIRLLPRELSWRIQEYAADGPYIPYSAGPLDEFQIGPDPDDEYESGDRERIETLLSVPIFQCLTEDEVWALSTRSYATAYQSGETIIEDGGTNQDLFVISHGLVEVRKQGRCLTQFGPGAIVGEMALISKSPRSASVMMAEQGEVICVPCDVYADLVDRHPEMWRDLCALMLNRLQTPNIMSA
jgi:hypothetical protein